MEQPYGARKPGREQFETVRFADVWNQTLGPNGELNKILPPGYKVPEVEAPVTPYNIVDVVDLDSFCRLRPPQRVQSVDPASITQGGLAQAMLQNYLASNWANWCVETPFGGQPWGGDFLEPCWAGTFELRWTETYLGVVSQRVQTLGTLLSTPIITAVGATTGSGETQVTQVTVIGMLINSCDPIDLSRNLQGVVTNFRVELTPPGPDVFFPFQRAWFPCCWPNYTPMPPDVIPGLFAVCPGKENLPAVEDDEVSVCVQVPVRLPPGEQPPVCIPCFEIGGGDEVTIETESVIVWEDDDMGGRRQVSRQVEYWRDSNGNTNRNTMVWMVEALSRLNTITPLYEELPGDVILADGVVDIANRNISVNIDVDCYFVRVEFIAPYPLNLRQYDPNNWGFGTARLSVPNSGDLPEVYSLRAPRNLIPVSGVKGRPIDLVMSLFPGLSYTVYATSDIPQGHIGRVRVSSTFVP